MKKLNEYRLRSNSKLTQFSVLARIARTSPLIILIALQFGCGNADQTNIRSPSSPSEKVFEANTTDSLSLYTSPVSIRSAHGMGPTAATALAACKSLQKLLVEADHKQACPYSNKATCGTASLGSSPAGGPWWHYNITTKFYVTGSAVYCGAPVTTTIKTGGKTYYPVKGKDMKTYSTWFGG